MKKRILQMKWTKRIVLIALLLSAVGMGKMYAYDFSAVCETGQTLYYSITDAENHYVAMVCPGQANYSNCWSGFTKPTGDIVLPENVQYEGDTYAVTSIGSYAFYNCSGLTGSLTIPNSVTTIGGSAFYYCSGLTGSLTIPNSVTTIGDYAFRNCSGFTGDLTIPNSVTTIGDYAFSYCSGLTGSLTIPNSVTEIGGYAFYNCSGFNRVYYSGSIEQWCNLLFNHQFSNPLYYAHNLYVNNELVTDLVIPETVTEIKAFAFYNATCLMSLTIPNSVTTIGQAAFSGCSGLTGSLTIPNSVTTIGNSAFSGCSGFTGSLTIPNSVTSIGSGAFYNCSGFTGSLTIGNSVTSIGYATFYNCTGFKGSLTIGNSVTTIGTQAFSCGMLRFMGFTGNLNIPNSVTTIGNGAFSYCTGFTGSLTIPNSVTEIDNSAFWWCCNFESVMVESGNTVYDSRENCNALIKTSANELLLGCKNTVIPNSVTTIGNSAFLFCSGLTGSLTIPNSVTTIGNSAFRECSGLTGSLTIPNSVTTIGDQAFSGCSGLTGSLTIPNSVTTIGDQAFSYCSGLTGSLTIGNSVTTIGYQAFYNCRGLTGSLTIGNSVTKIGDYSFYRCSGLTGSLTIPNSVTTIGWYAFYGCSGLTGSLTIGNSVTTIGSYAFYNCSGLTGSLTIPNSVTTIGSYAFYGCSGLNEAMLYNYNPPSLGSYAFSNTSFPIYVPYESLNDYKTATNWSNYEDRIFPMAYTTISGYGEGEDNYRFIASPLVENTAPTAVDNMITETPYDLYRFDQSEDAEWINYKANMEDFVLENGQGYLYANAEDVNLIFKGEFNEDDTKEVGLAYDATATFAGWNLVGNPFPVNAYANKSYYTMNEEGTAIEPVAVSMETAIPACTGVMVMAEAEGETVVFSTEAPEAATNQGCLQIELSQAVELVETPTRKQDGPSTGSGTLHDKAIVSFNAGDRLEKFVFNKENAVISIPQGGKELAIACSDKQGEMPLNFKATKNGEYTLTIHPEAVELDYLHLIDNLTGADVDLLALRQAQGPANYTFEAKTTDYASRFRLVFSGKEADGPSTGSGTFAFVNNGNVIITGAEVGATLQIVDMTGRVVASCGGHMMCVPTTGMAKGVYVLRLINGDDVKTQKIVIR